MKSRSNYFRKNRHFIIYIILFTIILILLANQMGLWSKISFTINPPKWTRIDVLDQGLNCSDFCRTRNKTCVSTGCEPDKWCHAEGGMMEIETWDQKQGIVCDRIWEGQCNVAIDRPASAYNFHCCCQ